MPFTYNLPVPQIPAEALDDSGGLRLVQFLVNEGEWIETGTLVAELETARAVVQVLANGQGVLRKKLAQSDAILRVGETLAVIAADGEAISYDRPYSLADISLHTD